MTAAVAPIETLALWVQMINAFKMEGASGFTCVIEYETGSLMTVYPIVSWVSLVCLALLYCMNVYNLLSVLFSSKLMNDLHFKVWRYKHLKTSYLFVLILQTLTNFKFNSLWVSGWLGKKRYRAIFTHNTGQKLFDRLVLHLGVACLLCVSLPVFLTNFGALIFYSWGSQLVIALIDMSFITVFSVTVHLMWLKQIQERLVPEEAIPLPTGHSSEEKEEEVIIEKSIEEPLPTISSPVMTADRLNSVRSSTAY
jgi:hypothetical protein